MKRCSKCQTDKDESKFYRIKKTGKLRAQCKQCVTSANNAREKRDPAKRTARSQAWRTKNPGRASAISRAWQLRHPKQFKAQMYRSRYGIDFEALWQAQDGKCASCRKPMVKGGKSPDSACVDHDRSCCPGGKSCGKCVRGIIHRNCNLVLGYAKDDLTVLRSALVP